jgi:cytochrome P450
MTSDPKALQYLLQTSGYTVNKIDVILQGFYDLLGNSILANEFDTHKRHRKAMLPAFGLQEARALTHIFQEKAVRVSSTSYILFDVDLYPF